MKLDNTKSIFGTLFIDKPEIGVVEALVESGLCQSRREARERVQGRAVAIRRRPAKSVKVTDVNHVIGELPALLWCGKAARLINKEDKP